MELSPCPFCKGNKTEIDSVTYWTGMRYVISNYRLIHRCDLKEDVFNTMSITGRFRTEQDAINWWNERHG